MEDADIGYCERHGISYFLQRGCPYCVWAEPDDKLWNRIKKLEADNARLQVERDSLRKALKGLEYWFDTDPEVLDAMAADTRADHERQLRLIREALRESK